MLEYRLGVCGGRSGGIWRGGGRGGAGAGGGKAAEALTAKDSNLRYSTNDVIRLAVEAYLPPPPSAEKVAPAPPAKPARKSAT